MHTLDFIRDKLHQYIDVADEQKLQAIYVLLESELEATYDLSEIELLHGRRNNHLNGLSKSFTAEESLQLVRQQRKEHDV